MIGFNKVKLLRACSVLGKVTTWFSFLSSTTLPPPFLFFHKIFLTINISTLNFTQLCLRPGISHDTSYGTTLRSCCSDTDSRRGNLVGVQYVCVGKENTCF